jgi:hypothetical protein
MDGRLPDSPVRRPMLARRLLAKGEVARRLRLRSARAAASGDAGALR